MRTVIARIMPCLVCILCWSNHQPAAAQRTVAERAVAQGTGTDDIVVIANRDVPSSQLDRDSLRSIFAMHQRIWPDGQAANVFVLPNETNLHVAFTKKCLSVFPHQLQLAWDRMVFSGTGKAPLQVHTQQVMLETVVSTPGAIGYIEKEYLDERVQVVTECQ